MRYAQLVVGPAGSGKSTYCSTMVKHASDSKRIIEVVNLDPAAEHFDYEPLVDIRELIHLDDAMEDEELQFGPNGGLVFCVETLLENCDWLEEQLGDVDDDYLLFDCPGQIELYTHLTVMRRLVDQLQRWNFRICVVFMVDSQFMVDGAKFLSGTMAALSVMVNLELPHVNILSKMDLLSKSARSQLDSFLDPDPHVLLAEMRHSKSKWHSKYAKLTEAIGEVIENFSLVRFYPLDIKKEESIDNILLTIDNIIQYGEDADVKIRDFDEPEPDDDFLDPDPHVLLAEMRHSKSKWHSKYAKLTEAIGEVIENFSLVRFYPLDIKKEESIDNILLTIDNIIQYGEDADVKIRDFDEPEPDDE